MCHFVRHTHVKVCEGRKIIQRLRQPCREHVFKLLILISPFCLPGAHQVKQIVSALELGSLENCPLLSLPCLSRRIACPLVVMSLRGYPLIPYLVFCACLALGNAAKSCLI